MKTLLLSVLVFSFITHSLPATAFEANSAPVITVATDDVFANAQNDVRKQKAREVLADIQSVRDQIQANAFNTNVKAVVIFVVVSFTLSEFVRSLVQGNILKVTAYGAGSAAGFYALKLSSDQAERLDAELRVKQAALEAALTADESVDIK